jgi:hypothetical protein
MKSSNNEMACPLPRPLGAKRQGFFDEVGRSYATLDAATLVSLPESFSNARLKYNEEYKQDCAVLLVMIPHYKSSSMMDLPIANEHVCLQDNVELAASESTLKMRVLASWPIPNTRAGYIVGLLHF